MSVTLSSEQSYRLLQSLGSFLQNPLSVNLKIGVSSQEVVILANSSPVPDNLEQLPLLVNCAAKNVINELKTQLPNIGTPRAKIVAINERLTTLTNAWTVIYTFSKTGWANEPRIIPIFNEAISFLNKNYTDCRSLYYYHLQEANGSIPETYRWLFDEQANIINNLRDNNHRLRERRNLMQVLLRGTSLEKDKMEVRIKELAAENRINKDQLEALEFSTQVVVEEKAVQEALRRSNSVDLARALAEAQMRLRALETESSSSFPDSIDNVRKQAAAIQQDLETERARTLSLQTELGKARSRLRFIFLFISTVSVFTLFFARRKKP